MIKQQYFLVEHRLSLNVEALGAGQTVPDVADFEAEIPAPFRMASDLAGIDAQSLQSLKLSNDSTQQLWQYLEAQNQKINILLSYVLSQQDDARFHFQTQSFSAGACFFTCTAHTFQVGQYVRLKIFIPEESAAIYCYAQVKSVTAELVELHYQQIREQDRELLIRTTLHIQSKQLKARAQQRAAQ